MSWVYCLSVAGSRALKVGMTARTPSARASDMHFTIGPAKLKVERAWRCPTIADARRLEAAVHRRLAHVRVAGEWMNETLAGIEDEIEGAAAALRIDIEPHPDGFRDGLTHPSAAEPHQHSLSTDTLSATTHHR